MNDVDFEQFIKLLDGALASDDKNVRNALKKFLFVAALALGDDAEPGPFTQMMETIDNLQRRISTLESQNNSTQTYPNTHSPWITYTTPTIYPNIGTPGTAAGTAPWGGTTTTTTTYSGGTNTYPGGYISTTLGDDKTGDKLKASIKDKLKGLVKAA